MKALNSTKMKIMAAASVAIALALGPGAFAQRPLGVDVSSYQGSSFNWAGEKSAGVSFGWAKATEGTYDDDPDYVDNQNNARSAGVLIGSYHFARPDLDAPGTEASFFWNQAGGYIKNDGKTIMPALDFETFNGVTGESTYSEWCNAWCDDIVNDCAGNGVTVRCVLYCSTCQACNFDSSVSQWIPWIANPSGLSAQTGSPWSDTTCPTCGGPIWGSGAWDLWQYASSSIDEDVFNGSTSDMESTLLIGYSSGSGANYSANVGPVTKNADGRLEMFAVGDGTDMYHDYQTSANGNWDGWINMANGNSIAGPACNRELNGCLDVFVECGSGKVWHNYQTSAGGSWNGWVTQNGPSITNLVALTNKDGRMEVFGIGSNGDVWHEWQTVVNGGWTSSWSDISGEHIKGGMVGIANQDGRLEIFGQGANGDVWHNWQTSAGQNFTNWADMGSSSSGLDPHLAVARNANGDLELFGIDSGGNVWHDWQTSPGLSWNGWVGFGGISGVKPGFKVGINKDGRLEMFGVGSNNDVWHTWQDEPGTRWSNWADMGGSGQNQYITIANNANGALQLFDIGNNSGDVWSVYQNSPGGSWTSWFDLNGNGDMFWYGQP